MVSEQNKRLAFRTQRLALRSVTPADFPAICRMEHPDEHSESALERTTELHEKLLDKNHLHMLIYLLPETQQLPSGAIPSQISWEDAGSGTSIGNAGMMSNYELGYLITPEYRRKGYASEAVAGILDHVWRAEDDGTFGSYPVDRDTGRAYVSATVEQENRSSVRVLEKVDAVEESPQDSEPQSPANAAEAQSMKPHLKRFRMYRPQ